MSLIPGDNTAINCDRGFKRVPLMVTWVGGTSLASVTYLSNSQGKHPLADLTSQHVFSSRHPEMWCQRQIEKMVGFMCEDACGSLEGGALIVVVWALASRWTWAWQNWVNWQEKNQREEKKHVILFGLESYNLISSLIFSNSNVWGSYLNSMDLTLLWIHSLPRGNGNTKRNDLVSFNSDQMMTKKG